MNDRLAIGGHARAASLTPAERSDIARTAALARWRGKEPPVSHPAPKALPGPPRVPKTRQALIVRIPEKDKEVGVVVLEGRDRVFLEIEAGPGSLARSIQLQVPEALALAEHLNRICRRIRQRPQSRP